LHKPCAIGCNEDGAYCTGADAAHPKKEKEKRSVVSPALPMQGLQLIFLLSFADWHQHLRGLHGAFAVC
jgi:hypothetical protein